MSNDILNMNVDAIDDIKDHPPGRYRGVVTNYKVDKNGNDKSFVFFEFKAQEPLDGQDVAGVEMNRTLRGERLFLTDSAIKYTKAALKAIQPAAGTLAEWFESMVGTEVEFTLKIDEVEKDGKTRKYANVVNARAA